MILCTAINHCLCDGVETSPFLHAWAHISTQSNLARPLNTRRSTAATCYLSEAPRKSTALTPSIRKPHAPTGTSRHHQIPPISAVDPLFLDLHRLSNPPPQPSFNCTTFETLASHTWRSWVRSLDLHPSLHVKLLFPVNIRTKLCPKIPHGYYGNAFVLGCAESSVDELAVAGDLNDVVRLVQNAKSIIDDDYVKSMIILLEDKRVQADLSASLVISDWSKLGLQDLDFGLGKPLEMGPLASDVFCFFLPVIGDVKAIRVLVSVPANVVEKFEYHMTGEYFSDGETNV